MSKSNVRIEGNIDNESCLTKWLDPKTVFEPNSKPKNSPLGLKKVKKYRKIRKFLPEKKKGNCARENLKLPEKNFLKKVGEKKISAREKNH